MSQNMGSKLAASVRGAKQSQVETEKKEAEVKPAVKEIEEKLVTPIISSARVWPD